MLRFQCFLGAKGPLITKGERQCSVFGSVFGTFERVCSVFQAIFMPFSVPKVDGFHRLEWVGMLRFRQAYSQLTFLHLEEGARLCFGNPKTPRSTMRVEKFCSQRSQKVSVPTVNCISNDKHTGTWQDYSILWLFSSYFTI